MNTRHAFLSLGVIASIVLLTARGYARIPPMPDANNAIFTATQVVIVSPGKVHGFTVERSYVGNLAVGSAIEVPGFKLVTWNKMGDEQPQPLTDDTRILMFLVADPKDPESLAVTDYGYAYFFRDVSKINELDAMANEALAYHKKWEEAMALADSHERIRALFPYALHSSNSCSLLTMKALTKLNPDAGDYLASLFAGASADETENLLLVMRNFPSAKSHAAAIAAVDAAYDQCKQYMADHHLESLDFKANWKDLPGDLKNADGIVYYGLAALRSFKDKADLPYFRDRMPFLLANDFDQAIEEGVDAMADHPAPENVPALVAVWKDYKNHHYPPDNKPLLPIYIARAMGAQADSDVIPALLDMLDNRRAHDSALEALGNVTNLRFSTDAQWKAWYAAQPKPVL